MRPFVPGFKCALRPSVRLTPENPPNCRSMSGYLTLTFLTLTPLLALASDWVRNNSMAVERGLIGGGLGLAAAAAFARVQ